MWRVFVAIRVFRSLLLLIPENNRDFRRGPLKLVYSDDDGKIAFFVPLNHQNNKILKIIIIFWLRFFPSSWAKNPFPTVNEKRAKTMMMMWMWKLRRREGSKLFFPLWWCVGHKWKKAIVLWMLFVRLLFSTRGPLESGDQISSFISREKKTFFVMANSLTFIWSVEKLPLGR